MKLTLILLTVLVAALVALEVAKTAVSPTPKDTAVAGKETAYDRVTRTNTLRCAYIVYPPETIKDPNTGALSGNIVELAEEAGKQLGWKVEWTTEVGFADMFEGFKTGRYDALCSGLWENPARAKSALFTIPINYSSYYAFVRSDDARFDRGLDPVNAPDVHIAVIDGEYADFIAKESFPKAQIYRLPQLSDISQTLLSVATRKADVAFMQKSVAKGFLEHNPGKLKIIEAYPVRVMPAPAMAIAPDEARLKSVLDAAFHFLLNNGEVEKIFRKRDPNLETYNPVAKPYASVH